MKRLILVILAAVAVISASIAFAADNSQVKVIVYYFHGSFRCYTCANMEKFSRETVKTNFKDVLDSGKLEFKAVNVEDRENEHFVNDYKLYTKSLVLSLIKDGKEARYKNLDKIWQFARNKQKFIDYVTVELKEFMKGVR